MTNDEFQALEDAILDIMAQDQKHVNNEDLRYRMNEINEPMEPSVPHTLI